MMVESKRSAGIGITDGRIKKGLLESELLTAESKKVCLNQGIRIIDVGI